MLIIYILLGISFILFLSLLYDLNMIKKVYHSHKLSHTTKYSNNGKFNEAYNLTINPSEEKSHHLEPVVDLDDKSTRMIIFINNINSVILGDDNQLYIDLNLKSEDNSSYYFITSNYLTNSDQTIATNIITSNFPKLFENDSRYYNTLDLKDLGYPINAKIKTDSIVSIIFNGRNREFIILTNDNNQSSFSLRYKSKKQMVSKIKETSLYKHIMQWGLPGYKDALLSYVESKDVNHKQIEIEEFYKNIMSEKMEGSVQ